MRTPLRAHRLLGLALSFSLLAISGDALAHVAFVAPSNGQALTVGSTVTIEWEDVIPHDTEGYDLDLLLTPDATPTPIAHGLATEPHTYDWQVPDQPCDQCQLKVTQLNTVNPDYDAVVAISISGAAGGGGTPNTTEAGGCSLAGASGSQRDTALVGVLLGALGLTSRRRRNRRG